MTEPMSLLPMARFGAQKALLIGDPLQLPPTLNTPSIATHKSGLDRTLFERMADSGHVPILLRTQYRVSRLRATFMRAPSLWWGLSSAAFLQCHPAIAAISNELFYKGQLKHGKTAADLPPLFDTFPTLCFVDVANGSETQRKGGTFVNNDAQLVIRVARKLIDRGMLPSEIGIICLYKGQAGMIHDALRSDGVQVSTCDAFQGAEKTVILLCTVRTQYAGFIDEPRRVNVALTRAKRYRLN
ncbi:AAA domain-containing protein [Powellomyces hirtus]|nr:AAA domain-containing protein [Powellomyces hirtus]